MQGAAPFPMISPVSMRRRRFLMVSIAMLGVLGIGLGVSFAGTTGTTSPTVTAGSTNWVFPLSTGASLPAAVDALKYTTAINAAGSTVTTWVKPDWLPIQDAAGTVTTAGEIAVVDAKNQSLLVTVYITNLHDLQKAYSGYAFKMGVYKCGEVLCDGTGDWTADTTIIPSTETVLLTNTEGFVQFEMVSGNYYAITIELGGTYFAYDTSVPGNLGPSYFFSATAI